MINEAFNDELLAETKDATSDIAESSGKLRTLLESLPENSFSDDEINFALGYYERIIQMKGENSAPANCVHMTVLFSSWLRILEFNSFDLSPRGWGVA